MTKYGGGGFEGKAQYFVGGGGWQGCFFFQSSGQLAFVKMYNFLQVMVLLKNAVCWNEKKVPIFSSPEPKGHKVSL